MLRALEKEVLLFGLDERYKSIHLIRERIQNITLRILGLLLGVSGLLIQSDLVFSCNEKTFFVVIIFFSALLIYFYLDNLRTGITSQRAVAVKLEQEFGFYKGDDSLYPKAWQNVERLPFLDYHCTMIGFGFVVLILSIVYFS